MIKTFTYAGNEKVGNAVSARLCEAGLKQAQQVASADMLLTFFTTMDEIENAYFGDDGFVQIMDAGSVVIDMSAASPSFAREMNAICTVSDLKFVEAPLVVKNMVATDVFARSNMLCFAAGEDDCLNDTKEILDTLFADVEIVGNAGAAQLARAANTIQNVAEIVSAIESRALFTAKSKSIGSIDVGGTHVVPANYAAQTILEAIEDDRYDGDFTCEMLMSELSAALMAADDFEVILPQAESAMHLLELLAVIGGSDKSPAALSLIYGDEAACAENGLDWERADQVFGSDFQFDSDDAEFDDGFIDQFEDDDDSGDIGFRYSAN